MLSRAITRYLRISPRKTRKVIDLIRGIPVVKAETILKSINKRPCMYLNRLIRSAVDSAVKIHKVSPGDLYISLIKADDGPSLKRYRAASMGRASSILHRTSHITVELDMIKRPIKKEKTEEAKQPKKRSKKIGTKSTSV